MKKKLKTTSFWLGLSGALFVVLDTISKIVGLNLYSKEVESIILAVCSFLIMVGFITKRNETETSDSSKEELLEDINDIDKDK